MSGIRISCKTNESEESTHSCEPWEGSFHGKESAPEFLHFDRVVFLILRDLDGPGVESFWFAKLSEWVGHQLIIK